MMIASWPRPKSKWISGRGAGDARHEPKSVSSRQSWGLGAAIDLCSNVLVCYRPLAMLNFAGGPHSTQLVWRSKRDFEDL